MMRVISAVTTSVIRNVTTILIATATPVESSSSDSSSSGDIKNPHYCISYIIAFLLHLILAMYEIFFIIKLT